MKQMKDSGLTPQKKKASDIFLEPNYTIQKITIDKNNISTFFPLTWMRRDIRKNQVNSILRGLREKQHFDVPLVLMQHNGDQYRYIIDGNHRMEAIKHFLKIEDNEFNDNAIDVYSIIYEKLNKDEIRKIYAVWNTGIRQNTDDYIMAFKETIPMFNKIVTELPCDVYGNRDRLKFKHFVGGYFAAKYEGMFQGGFSGSAMDFVDQSKKLTEKDVEVIVEFWNDFITAFALPVHQQNMRTIPHVKTSPFYAIFRVVSQQKTSLS